MRRGGGGGAVRAARARPRPASAVSAACGLPSGVPIMRALKLVLGAVFTPVDHGTSSVIETVAPRTSSSVSATLAVLGGDDAGVGAAWAAGQLGIDTVLVLSHPRDLGGDFTQFIPTDLALTAHSMGGLNFVYDTFARRHTNQNSGRPDYDQSGRVAPPGPSFDFLSKTLQELGVRILPGFLPAPSSGRIVAGAVQGLDLVARNGSTISLSASFIIDGTPEGYGAAAFRLPVRFGREGRVLDRGKSVDATTFNETFAGRRIFGHRQMLNQDVEIGAAPLIEQMCDHSEEMEDSSMAASPAIPLREYGAGQPMRRGNESWLLTRPPKGYNRSVYDRLSFGTGPHNGRGVFRYEGNARYLSVPEWYYKGQQRGVHYLRSPTRETIWADKLLVERRIFSFVVGALYHAQQHATDGWRYGIDRDSWSSAGAPYSLDDFGTSTFGSEMSGAPEYVGCRVYHRVLARLATTTPVGGAMMLRRDPVPAAGYPFYAQKAFWEPTGIAVPTLEVDYHSVLADSVPSPTAEAGPEGECFTSLDPKMDGCNSHSIAHRILLPADPQRTKVDNFLSPGSPASTFMAQAGLRAGSSSSQLGVAAVATVAVAISRSLRTSEVAPLDVQQLCALQLRHKSLNRCLCLVVAGPLTFSSAAVAR
eukprot:COSAG03_NODE_1603_length_3801_cov_82.441923_4_plen_647_part_00